jgi:hypothetical protein
MYRSARFSIGSPTSPLEPVSQKPSTSVDTLPLPPATKRPSRSPTKATAKGTKGGPLARFKGFTESGLPLTSSPAPAMKRNHNSFDYDATLSTVANIRNALCMQAEHYESSSDSECGGTVEHCSSAPASTNLLGNFEASVATTRG